MIVEVLVSRLLDLGVPPADLDAIGLRPSDATLRVDWTADGLRIASKVPRLYQCAYDAGELPRVVAVAHDLRRCHLVGAYMPGAVLAACRVEGVDLGELQAPGAVFAGAGLHGANLRGANLRGATLSGANLVGADLTGADLVGADLVGVRHDERTLWTDADVGGAVWAGPVPQAWTGRWVVDGANVVEVCRGR